MLQLPMRFCSPAHHHYHHHRYHLPLVPVLCPSFLYSSLRAAASRSARPRRTRFDSELDGGVVSGLLVVLLDIKHILFGLRFLLQIRGHSKLLQSFADTVLCHHKAITIHLNICVIFKVLQSNRSG